MTKPFAKTYLTPREHVELLKSRGLQIDSIQKAEEYIATIGYFRLTAYFFPLLQIPKANHLYKSDATFRKAVDMYRFDRKLRLILLNEIEKIEVAARARIANGVSEATGNIFWMSEPSLFANSHRFQTSIGIIDAELDKSKEDFIAHFRENYSDTYPPAWMIAEILPLGTLTHIYANLKDNSLRKKIANGFGLNHNVLFSWLIVLYGLRNMCCHHSRTWNRELPIITTEPKKTKYKWIDATTTDKRRMYYRICMIRYLLFSISPNNSYKERLISLFNDFPTIDKKAMGFPDGWEQTDFWN